MIFFVSNGAFAEAVSDVRVIIDVSGSMKKNDPHNLRAPALKLLVGLMPNGTRSGVWTFGKYVNMQVKLGTVNDAWKDKARIEAKKIHSRGQYTNLELAIDKATADWLKPDPMYRRHLIILTDGVIDVSENDVEDEQSKQRILQQQLPRLENADVTIHTIALSKNVDFELLYALAGATKGSFEQVDSAEALQKLFLRIFEKTVTPDSLPIEGNKFEVDEHVDDITVLIFLAKDSPATQLISPTKNTYTQDNHAESVKWHHEDGYDLITIKKPEPGEWNLVAKVDPDNRVMIVTNLKLKTDRIENILMYGDQLQVKARLLEDGKTVTNKDLLAQTKFVVKQVYGDEHVKSTELVDSGGVPDVIKGDGVYSVQIEEFPEAGSYELVIQSKSLTFKREVRHTLEVYDSPANIEITQKPHDGPFVINVKPHAGLIRPETVSMQITIEGNEPQIVEQLNDLEWSIEVPAENTGKKFVLTIAATRYTDQTLKMDFEQVLAVTKGSQSLAFKVEATKHEEPEHHDDHADEHKEDDKHGNEDVIDELAGDKQEEEGFSWTVVMILIAAVNLLVFGGGYIGYRIWKKKKAKTDESEEEELTV